MGMGSVSLPSVTRHATVAGYSEQERAMMALVAVEDPVVITVGELELHEGSEKVVANIEVSQLNSENISLTRITSALT